MIKTMAELTVQGKRVLVRQDLNVPFRDGRVASTARIDAALPTIETLLGQGARVAVMSHSGRPKEGMCEPEFSLAPVAKIMARKLGRHVPLITDWIDGFEQTDDLVLLETLARAIIMSPDVILADEPTGNIDWEMSQRLIRLLIELNHMGKTIVIATHDLNLIRFTKASVQARVLRISNKRVQLAGSDL